MREHIFNDILDISRAICNLIRTCVVTQGDTTQVLCRVKIGGIETFWLNWLTTHAGCTRVWWWSSMGEQMLLLAVSGKLCISRLCYLLCFLTIIPRH